MIDYAICGSICEVVVERGEFLLCLIYIDFYNLCYVQNKMVID